MFKNRFLIVLGLLSLLLVAMAVALPPASAPTNSAIQRGREAYAARWTRQGEFYQNRAIDQAERERSRAADAARWAAMGEYYKKLEESQIQRSRAADTARWDAVGEYYLNQARRERGQAADAARWTAMADYYLQVFGT